MRIVLQRRIKVLERRRAFLEMRCKDHKGGDWDREEINALTDAIEIMKEVKDGQDRRI